MKPRKSKTKAKPSEAIELRLQGMTYDKIAQQLGYVNGSVAYQAIRRELRRLTSEAVTNARRSLFA